MSILILAVALILVFRWRMNKVRRQMEEQFGEGFDPRNFGGQGFGSPFAGEPRKGREGEVKVRKTSGRPKNGCRKTSATTSSSKRRKSRNKSSVC